MKNIKIIAYGSEPFKDRVEAGKILAATLKEFVDKESVVLGIPRGGIVIASEIAKELSIELDIVLSRKIGAPSNPEFAIGAVSETGRVFLNEDAAGGISASDKYVIKEREHEFSEIKRRIEVYRKVKPKTELEGKIVIICDDGIATGATMQAGIWAIRQEEPKKIIIAVPVAPYDTLQKLANEADMVLCLRVPEFFAAVGQFYLNFSQVSDKEVLELIKRGQKTK